jgi:pimeloyl-ACP methyl ester carboxylesterase
VPTIKRFTTWDEIEIAYQEWGNRDSSLPVVLHHGFVVDANANWALPGVVDALLRAGRWVVAPDARGHGHSEKPHDPAAYGEQSMARDLAVLLDVINRPQADLVGYSMGAIVALLLASDDQRVRRLVVGGVGAGVIECGGVDRRAVSNESIIQAFRAQDAATIEDTTAQAFRALADAVEADREALVAQAFSRHRGGVALERISAPTLVLAGDSDPLAVRPEVLVAAIPRATLKIVSGDHMGAIADPRFTQSMVEFLA